MGMSINEQAQMLMRVGEDIRQLRNEIDRLRPRAEAYDAIASILGLLPKRLQGAGEDCLWQVERKLREIQAEIDAENEKAKAGNANR